MKLKQKVETILTLHECQDKHEADKFPSINSPYAPLETTNRIIIIIKIQISIKQFNLNRLRMNFIY